jgi:hypothetical protein
MNSMYVQLVGVPLLPWDPAVNHTHKSPQLIPPCIRWTKPISSDHVSSKSSLVLSIFAYSLSLYLYLACMRTWTHTCQYLETLLFPLFFPSSVDIAMLLNITEWWHYRITQVRLTGEQIQNTVSSLSQFNCFPASDLCQIGPMF